MSKRAVALLSGGVDSSTALAIAKAEGFSVYALSFKYGQRHSVELESAHRVAQSLGVQQHLTAEIDLRMFGSSALTDDIAVPKDREADEMSTGIPVTYVPARNTIFLSFAVAFAEVIGAEDIFTGMNALDYSGYPDCRPEYIEAYELMANLATRSGVEGTTDLKIHTPLIQLTKAEIVRKGLDLGVDYAKTWSCYDPQALDIVLTASGVPSDRTGIVAEERIVPCGKCDSCILRAKGFAELGETDPLLEKNE